MATNALTVDAGHTVDSDAVRDIYISAVNAAVAADRDDLAMEIAAEYETETEYRPWRGGRRALRSEGPSRFPTAGGPTDGFERP